MIKNIIFDFGDIFIDLDKEATHRALKKLGVDEVSEEMLLVAHQFEIGAVSSVDFIAFFEDTLELSKAQLTAAWNAILLGFPKHRLQFLKDLSRSNKYRLFLLSNTNALHIEWIQNDWGSALYEEFKNCFEQFYLSHEIHFRKPDASIYEFVLRENNLKATETFFIDDTLENTEAARKLGIQTWNLVPGEEDVVDLLTKKELNP